jgi:hypothetical protein
MQGSKESFLDWVSDPARSNDELFPVEILLEHSRGYQWPHELVDGSFEAQMERARQRKANPAHRPSLHLEELRTLIEQMDKKIVFSGAYGEDRPLRNLSALRFFPFLTNVSVQSSDVTDFRPIASLPLLNYLSIAEYEDLYGCHPICLAQCGAMPNLERLNLTLRHPWPDLRAMGDWPKLNYICYSGSVLAMEEVASLPAARVVLLKSWPQVRGELRNLRRLPLVPVARELTIESVASLEGIERYASVVNLNLSGCYRDLSPLAQMDKITALKLTGERFQDLRPLIGMKSLRELVLRREWPIDLSPLAECPQLRRVTFERSATMRTEVAALNAGLLPEADDFLAPSPRPLGELKLYRLEKDSPGEKHFNDRITEIRAARAALYDGDAMMEKAGARVFLSAMQTRFDELLGRGWGIFGLPFTSLKRYQDTTRLRELIDAVRDHQRRLRHPLRVTFIVEPHGDMTEELEQIKARTEEEEASPDEDFLIKYYDEDHVLEENAEARERREKRYELLKREHLLRLRGEEEAGVLLGLPEEEPVPDETAEDTSFENEPQSENDKEGGVAIAPPPTPPPDEKQEEIDLSEALMFYLDVWEDCVAASPYWAERAEYCLGERFEEWMPPESGGQKLKS